MKKVYHISCLFICLIMFLFVSACSTDKAAMKEDLPFAAEESMRKANELMKEGRHEDAREILDAVMRELGFKGQYKPIEHPAFCEGRVAEVSGPNQEWAIIGEIHPQVLINFGLASPAVFCELRLMKVI